MKLGIMQPYFFPYIGYWQLLNAVDKYVVYDDVNFIKNGWILRNRILVNGQASFFNLIAKGASPNLLINEITLADNMKVKEKSLKTLEFSYKKAPFFDQAFPVLQKIILSEEANLAKYLFNSLSVVKDYLGIKTELILSSNLNKDNNLKAQDKIIAICQELGAKEYLNAEGGQDLYNKADFNKNNLILSFLKTQKIEYKQFKNEFVPYLSIIDVMMFNSVNDIRELLSKFQII